MSNMNPVTLQKIDTLRENYLKDEKARVVRNALVKNDIGTISRNFDAERNNPNIFSIDLKQCQSQINTNLVVVGFSLP